MSQESKGQRDDFTAATPYNQLDFIIERKIREIVNTAALVRVDSCTSQGSSGPAGEVSATPLVAQTDAEGNALPMVEIPRMPHARYQAGIAAIILDPVPGDIGVAVFCKSDSSTVKTGATEPQRPGSHRAFDMADGMLVGNVQNKAPEVWIELKQDKTILIHAPEGCTVETDKDVTVNAGQNVTMTAGTAITLTAPNINLRGALSTTGQSGGATTAQFEGTVNASDDVTASGISLHGHTHTGVESGSGSTGAPQ